MPRPYLQVALTYVQRPFSSVGGSFLTLFILFILTAGFFTIGMADGPNANHHEFSPLHLMLFVILFAYWAIHSKEQFADARASLIPGFRRIHGAVASLTAIVFGIVLPAAFAPIIGWQSLAFVSITILLFGASLWFVLLHNNVINWLILLGVASTLTEPIRGGLEQIVLGHSPVHAFALFGIGAALSIVGIVRLLRINEEMPEYHLNLQVDREGQFQMSGRQWQTFLKSRTQGLRGRLLEKFTARSIYHAHHASDSKWSRVQRWLVSDFSGWSICPHPAWYYLFLLMFYLLTADKEMIYVWAAIFFPAMHSVVWLQRKKPFLSHELMLPVERDAYLKQLGMAAVESQLVEWGTSMAALFLVIFTTALELRVELLAYTIAYSALAQIWFFGVGVWLHRFRSIVLPWIIGPLFTFIPASTPLIALHAPFLSRWRPLILPIGVLLACLGMLFAWRAYRYWLITDFD